MRILRPGKGKCIQDEALPQGIRQVLLGTDHVCYAHQSVVHCASRVTRRSRQSVTVVPIAVPRHFTFWMETTIKARKLIIFPSYQCARNSAWNRTPRKTRGGEDGVGGGQETLWRMCTEDLTLDKPLTGDAKIVDWHPCGTQKDEIADGCLRVPWHFPAYEVLNYNTLKENEENM